MIKEKVWLLLLVLLSAPVMAEGWEKALMPDNAPLEISDPPSLVAPAAAETPQPSREKGFIGKIGDVAVGSFKKVVVTPFRVVGSVVDTIEKTSSHLVGFGGEKSATPSDDFRVSKDIEVPSFALSLPKEPDWNSLNTVQIASNSDSGETAMDDRASVRKGMRNEMRKVQILLQDIVPIEDK